MEHKDGDTKQFYKSRASAIFNTKESSILWKKFAAMETLPLRDKEHASVLTGHELQNLRWR